MDQSTIADFMCSLADSSSRPESHLKTASAAISQLFQALDVPDITQCSELSILKSALVKSGTTKPMQKSKVMPVAAFTALFNSWPNYNSQLDIKRLRLKCLTLQACLL